MGPYAVYTEITSTSIFVCVCGGAFLRQKNLKAPGKAVEIPGKHGNPGKSRDFFLVLLYIRSCRNKKLPCATGGFWQLVICSVKDEEADVAFLHSLKPFVDVALPH